MKERALFETNDPYLTASISKILNIMSSFKGENGWTTFTFPISDDLYKAIAQYSAGIPLNAFELCQTIRQLRAVMVMRRNERGGA